MNTVDHVLVLSLIAWFKRKQKRAIPAASRLGTRPSFESCHTKIVSSDLCVIKEAAIHLLNFEEKLGGISDERYVGGSPIAIDVLMCDLQRLQRSGMRHILAFIFSLANSPSIALLYTRNSTIHVIYHPSTHQ